MFPASVQIIIMSHLSDLQEGTAVTHSMPPVIVHDKINFIKNLILKYPNLKTEVDADKEYAEYQVMISKRGKAPIHIG